MRSNSSAEGGEADRMYAQLTRERTQKDGVPRAFRAQRYIGLALKDSFGKLHWVRLTGEQASALSEQLSIAVAINTS